MPKDDDVYEKDVPTGKIGLRKVGGTTDTTETDKQKFKGFTAGKAGAKADSGAGMPKQKDYATTDEWMAATRKWRDDQRAGRASAVSGKVAATAAK